MGLWRWLRLALWWSLRAHPWQGGLLHCLRVGLVAVGRC